jgi:heptosyltransferase-2/heptosyltransferase-3
LLLWEQQKTHSVEQQLALLGWTGVPVTDRPRTNVAVSADAARTVAERLEEAGLAERQIALIHPAAAFATKQWAAENFARVAESLAQRGFAPVAIVAPNEREILESLLMHATGSITPLDLSLPEVSALAARSQIFVGNDSGIAHIAAAVGAPSVVIFGSSNVAHWRPWNKAAAEVVVEQMPCQPCHGYFCEKFPQPECILRVPVERVVAAIDRVLS